MIKEAILPKKVNFFESMKSSYEYDVDFMKSDRYWLKAQEDYERLFLNSEKMDGESRIPRKIHQIWLGSPFPDEYKNWQKSWKKYHPDWEYYLWTDEKLKDFDFKNREVFEKTSNFGSKSDILRYEILNQLGGLYVDTDFECFFPFDFLHLNCDFYCGIVYGKEFSTTNAIIGSAPDHPVMKQLISEIDTPLVSNDVSKIHEISGPWALTRNYRKFMFDKSYDNLCLPTSYFFPFPNNKLHIRSEKKIKEYVKPESMAIHYWEVSWTRKSGKLGKLISRLLRYIPTGLKNRIKDMLKK
jgi:mannosyltransferase OCH1-like enzyme